MINDLIFANLKQISQPASYLTAKLFLYNSLICDKETTKNYEFL